MQHHRSAIHDLAEPNKQQTDQKQSGNDEQDCCVNVLNDPSHGFGGSGAGGGSAGGGAFPAEASPANINPTPPTVAVIARVQVVSFASPWMIS